MLAAQILGDKYLIKLRKFNLMFRVVTTSGAAGPLNQESHYNITKGTRFAVFSLESQVNFTNSYLNFSELQSFNFSLTTFLCKTAFNCNSIQNEIIEMKAKSG